MENKKQTAIEWLKQELKDRYPLMNSEPFFEQAKEMEKEQIEMAFAKSYLIGLAEVNYDDVNRESEQYYNETYGTKQVSICPQFTLDSKTSSATKCICGREKLEHKNL